MHIYKICTDDLWQETLRSGIFPGMPIDITDGYVHFSTAEQQAETLSKYFAGQKNLVVLTVESESLGNALKWEASSSGTRAGLFPHYYGMLKREDVIEAVGLDAVKA